MRKTVTKKFKHFQAAAEALAIKEKIDFDDLWGTDDIDDYKPVNAKITQSEEIDGFNSVIVKFTYHTI